MRSMTGYGRGECDFDNRRFTAEIKSVNHKYSDIAIKMPRFLIKFEDKIRKLIQAELSRGKIDVYISFETQSDDDVNVSINNPLADSYYKAVATLYDNYFDSLNIPKENKADFIPLIAKMPDVLTVEKQPCEDNLYEGLETAVKNALAMITQMRTAEGNSLKESIVDKVNTLSEILKVLEEKAPEVDLNYRKRLTAKLSELEELKLDESRIVSEVLIFSDKACIDEEITRLHSHISQLTAILNEEIPVGRKMDFIVQEMNREANTIASKAGSIDITNCAIDMKSEIEKIREQIQNIE